MEFLCDVMFVNFGGGGVGDGFNIAELLTDVNKVVLLTIVEFLFLFQVFCYWGPLFVVVSLFPIVGTGVSNIIYYQPLGNDVHE